MKSRSLFLMNLFLIIILGNLVSQKEVIAKETALENTTITLRLVDQNGVEISGSYFNFGNPIFQVVSTGGSIVLAPGNYGVYLVPAVFGIAQQSVLNRFENFTVSTETTEITFEWQTFSGPMAVRDGTGALIPGSALNWGNPYFTSIANNQLVTLPVTDPSVYPNVSGGGYGVYVVPGIFSIAHQSYLNRFDNFTVSPQDHELTFTWLTADGKIFIVDETETRVDGSSIYFGNPYFTSVLNGDAVSFPVGLYKATLRPGDPGVSQLFASFEIGISSGIPFINPSFFDFAGINYGIRIMTTEEVLIDIRPGNSSNIINLKSKGKIPVAILSTENFDATTVDPLSVTFGPGEARAVHERGHFTDIDNDGDIDLLLHFKIQDCEFPCESTEAILNGITNAGIQITGEDAIQTIHCDLNKTGDQLITPGSFRLLQNYPNPFNPATTISYHIPEQTHVRIDIFDVTGKRIKTLLDAPIASGTHSIKWQGTFDDGKTVPSGVYFYRMIAGSYVQTRKLLFLK